MAVSTARTNGAGRSARRSRSRVRGPCGARRRGRERTAHHRETAGHQVEHQHAERIDVRPYDPRARLRTVRGPYTAVCRSRPSRGRGDVSCRSWPAPKSIRTTRPPSSRMTFRAVTSRCSKPAPCTADKARQRSVPTPVGFARAQRTVLLDDLVQRAAANELHPDADRAVARFGAIDGDDVRMAHSRQEPAFVDDARGIAQRGGRIVNSGGRAEQLERDLAIEVRIPCPIHLAEGAAADRFEQSQVPPGCR